MTTEISAEQLNEYQEAFQLFDKNGDGTITVTELGRVIEQFLSPGPRRAKVLIDSPYEAPAAPEVHIDTTIVSPEHAADLIVDVLLK